MFKPFYCCFGLFFRRTSFCSSRSVHPALQAVLCSPCIANVLNFLIQRRPTRTLFYSNFQGFTYCSIFDFQGSHALSSERRRRDLNPRAATNDLLPFQGSPFGQLGYFSKSGEGGIRTHAPFRTNGFQDRLVMTASISLQTCLSIIL